MTQEKWDDLVAQSKAAINWQTEVHYKPIPLDYAMVWADAELTRLREQVALPLCELHESIIEAQEEEIATLQQSINAERKRIAEAVQNVINNSMNGISTLGDLRTLARDILAGEFAKGEEKK